jgi:hypothetical protein
VTQSRNEMMLKSATDYDYDVALSFADEDRIYAEALAETLSKQGIRVFYDKYEMSSLWGKNLYTYLSDLYQYKVRYCVMFLSREYAAKLWTNHERTVAQARSFKENEEYILPIRLDNTEIPGILPTTSYLDWHKMGVDIIAHAVVEKLKGSLSNSVDPISDRQSNESRSHYRLNTSTIKVLVVFANPKDTDPLRLEKEDRAIHERVVAHSRMLW